MPNTVPKLCINVNFRIVDPQPKVNVNKNSTAKNIQYADQKSKLPHSSIRDFFVKKGQLADKNIQSTETKFSVLKFIKSFFSKSSKDNEPELTKMNGFKAFNLPNFIVNKNYRPSSDNTVPKQVEHEMELQKNKNPNSDRIHVTKQHSNDSTKNNILPKDHLTSTIENRQNEIKNLDKKIIEKIEKAIQLNAEIGNKNLETQNLSDSIENNRLKIEELKANIETNLTKEQESKVRLETNLTKEQESKVRLETNLTKEQQLKARLAELMSKVDTKLEQLMELDSVMRKHLHDHQDVHIGKFWINDYEHLHDFGSGVKLDNYDHLHHFASDVKSNEPQNLYSKPSKITPPDDYKLPVNNDLNSESEYEEISNDPAFFNIK